MSYGTTGRLHNDPYCFYGIRRRSMSTTEEGQWAAVDRREPLQPLSQW